MLEKIIAFSVRNKLIVILFTLTVAAFGVFSIFKIPVGAVPDITNNQVQVITTSGNLSTQEIEQFITAPVEMEMANLPGVLEIRSISKFGISLVTVVFEESMGTYLPRQLIAEKIKSASSQIPEGFGTPEMGPISTGLGEIYQYIVDVKPGYEELYSPIELRTIQDWVIKRRLSGIKGVVEVNSWGGYLKQYEIAVSPVLLESLNVSLLEVFDALKRNNSISGGAYIEKENQSYFIRGDGQLKSLEDIERVIVSNNGAQPILVKDVATVHFGHANRFGAITANGKGETVLGQIMMLKDADSKEVINEVKKRVTEIQESLPEGVFINPVLERSELIGKTSFTVAENLILGAIIVMLTVILLLGNLRSALVIASMIPLALLFTISMMYIFGIDANLMSLGALDFGIIIDGAVIIVEYIAIKTTLNRKEIHGLAGKERISVMDRVSISGASKMMKSAIFGQIIILIVFIPVLSLSGVEGKMFQPMALSFSFAIIGAMIFGLTWLPVASAMFLKPAKSEKKNISDHIMGFAHKSYLPVLKWSLTQKKLVFGMAIISLVLTGFIFSKMGGEFVPTLDEGDFVIQPVLKTGTSLSKTVEMTTKMENILIDNFPEVDQIVCRIGAAEVPTDPMSMEEIDMIIKLHPRDTWVNADSKEELAVLFKDALSIIPGVEYEFTQPIEMRFNELITGVRSDIAIKLFGEDLEYIETKASEIKSLVENVPGAADVILEKTAGLPQIKVTYDRQKMAYYGLDAAVLNTYLSTAFGGGFSGVIFEGEKRFDMVVRLPKELRTDISGIEQLKVSVSDNHQIPLSEVAEIIYTTGPAKISRENTRRRVVVSVNVRNRDLQSVIGDIQSTIDDNLILKAGNFIEYGGQFENLNNATNRLLLAVPVAMLLIFIFLHFAFKSLKDAIMIFTAIPLSTVGGVLLLWLRDMPFSVSAGIGFIALFGVAVLNGIVLIEHLKELQHNGLNMRELIIQGTRDRLRPVLLTAAAAAMGFLPMAISTGAGAEVQRPLATVVIGGLVTSTMLTMIILPLLFEVFYNKKRAFSFGRFVKSRGLMLSLLMFVPVLMASAQKSTLSLPDVLSKAVENNKGIAAEALRLKEAGVLTKTAYDIDKTVISYGTDQNNIAENGYALNVWGVEQSFRFPTSYRAQKKLLLNDVATAEVMLELEKQRLKKNVSQLYFSLQIVLNKQVVYKSLDSLYAEKLQNVELRVAKGDLSQLDLYRMQAQRERIKFQLNQLNFDAENRYKQLGSMMNYDSAFTIPNSLEVLPFRADSVSIIEYSLWNLRQSRQELLVRALKNNYWPDINLGYYIGSNNHEDSKHYHGVQIGVAVPLFYGSHKAKVDAAGLSSEALAKNIENEQDIFKSLENSLKSERLKYKQQLDYYNLSGLKMQAAIVQMATKSFDLGEIGFTEFVNSIEQALGIQLSYFDNVVNYNYYTLELMYLSYN